MNSTELTSAIYLKTAEIARLEQEIKDLQPALDRQNEITHTLRKAIQMIDQASELLEQVQALVASIS